MPMLNDPNFRQTVVLLCEYGSEGALGVVVNRPTEVPVSTLIDDFPNLAGTERVFAGGLVVLYGLLILCRGTSEENPIVEGVFVAKDLESLKTPGALGPDGEVRCYLGYAGWSPGQLETEVASGAWQMLPADSTLFFFAYPAALWPLLMRRLGPVGAFYATLPPYPNLN